MEFIPLRGKEKDDKIQYSRILLMEKSKKDGGTIWKIITKLLIYRDSIVTFRC